MAEIKVVLPGGSIAIVSGQQSADDLRKIVLGRQEIAANYCKEKGLPIDPTQLTFEQIIEIRNTAEWINAGK